MITRSAIFVSLILLLAGAVQANERGYPAKAEVTQVDRGQNVLSLAVDDDSVKVGDLFVVPRKSGYADTSEEKLAVIGIESVGKDRALGKLLFGLMPSVGAALKRFYGIPAVLIGKAGKPRPVTPALKSGFPDLVWSDDGENVSGVPLVRFQVTGRGQAVATFNNTWLIGILPLDTGQVQAESVRGDSPATPFAKLPIDATSLSAVRSGDNYYFAAEHGNRISFFLMGPDGIVRKLTSLEVPRREKVIRMDWYVEDNSYYLILNQWNGRSVSSALIQLADGKAKAIDFIPLVLGLQDLDADGRRETVLGQPFYSEKGFGSEIYKISISPNGFEKANSEELSKFTPFFRVIGAVVQNNSEYSELVAVSQEEVSVFPAGTMGSRLSYEIENGVAGTSISYDVQPELVFSPRQTLFLPNLLVLSNEQGFNIGIPQKSGKAENMIGVYETRVDWLTLRPGKSPETRSTSLLTSAPVFPVSGNTGLFFMSPAESLVKNDSVGFETSVYRAPMPEVN